MAARPALRLQPEEPAPGSWKRFFVVLAGRTNGVHEFVVKHFKSLGQTKVKSPEDADYCLVFCPVVSRVGTDVSEALDHLLPDKGAVLVVMHQSFNREQVIPRSRRLVEDQRVRLTLDCLFHQDKLLKCELNKNMNNNIKKFFRGSRSKKSRGGWSLFKCLGGSGELSDPYQRKQKQRMISSGDGTRKDLDVMRVNRWKLFAQFRH